MIRDSFIKSALKNIKKAIVKNKYSLANRSKNIAFMRDYFLDTNDLKEIILNLKPRDCIEGPDKDRDGYEGFIFIFKSNYIEEILIYIKIRYNLPKELVIISFHKDN